jgi:hypothetical protein
MIDISKNNSNIEFVKDTIVGMECNSNNVDR